LLRYLFTNDVARLEADGDASYGCMLREDGGVLDDLVVFLVGDSSYRLVVNAGPRDHDLAWILGHAEAYDVEVLERRDLAMIAVQGPNARDKAAAVLDVDQRERALGLRPFQSADCGGLYVARTGYTGEDGWEMLVPSSRAVELWQALAGTGIGPAGLAARDTLRLEAGMSLYGADMDETTHPLEARLGWTIAWSPSDRHFIGRAALERIRAAGSPAKLVGLVLEGRGVLRGGQRVSLPGEDDAVGRVTSGTFSPTLQCSIGFARVPERAAGRVGVEVRGKTLEARVVAPPFVRHGCVLIQFER
jgi:aminomethyltransferase